MSRHHMLPPIVYAPPPAPKKIEKKRRINVGAAGAFDEMEETGETDQASAAGRSTPVVNKLPPQNFPAIEGAESKPEHPRGRLSEGTLKAMLQAQEME